MTPGSSLQIEKITLRLKFLETIEVECTVYSAYASVLQGTVRINDCNMGCGKRNDNGLVAGV